MRAGTSPSPDCRLQPAGNRGSNFLFDPDFKYSFFSEFIPIPKIKNQKSLTEQVKNLLTLHKNLSGIPENSEKWSNLKREIEKLKDEIDQMVYELYELTAEEIKIVEGKL